MEQGKHDMKFNWNVEPATYDYYERRIKSLQDQLETAETQIQMKTHYIERLETEISCLTEENEKLKSALIGMALREA